MFKIVTNENRLVPYVFCRRCKQKIENLGLALAAFAPFDPEFYHAERCFPAVARNYQQTMPLDKFLLSVILDSNIDLNLIRDLV